MPFHLKCRKISTQRRDIENLVIFLFLQIYIYNIKNNIIINIKN